MSLCAACGQAIHGRYLQALGGDWHPQCFLCPDCRQPIGSAPFIEKKGYPFHEACFAKNHAPTCPGCGFPITGSLVKALDRSWHPQCLCCGGCGRPIEDAGFLHKKGKPFHPRCYHQQNSPMCVICAGPVQSLGFFTNGWGETYCEEHGRQYAPCQSCHRLMAPRLTGGGVVYNDGRTLCTLCRKTAIDHEVQGSQVLRDVRSFLHQQGMSFPDQPIPLRLTHLGELQRLISSPAGHRHPLGLTRTRTYTRGRQEVDRVLEGIVILHGLPREHFAMVVAHELAHAWIFLHQLPPLPLEVEEGMAALCEFLWLQHQQTPHAAYRLKLLDEDRDPIYGQGFQAARASWQRLPLPALLAFLQKHQRWPITNPLARLLGLI